MCVSYEIHERQCAKHFKHENFKFDMSYALFNQLSYNFRMKTSF